MSPCETTAEFTVFLDFRQSLRKLDVVIPLTFVENPDVAYAGGPGEPGQEAGDEGPGGD